jgi:glycosyltransferase involved in cell wall biosynthesis
MKSQPVKTNIHTPKILYVITQGAWGGAQRYVFDLATHLADDFDITVAVGETNGGKDLQEKIKDRGSRIKVIQLKHLVRKISPTHDLLAIFELKKLYKKLQPDIIHLNSSKAGILGVLAKFKIRNSKFEIIYTVHGWVFNEPLSTIKKHIYLFLERWTAHMKDTFIILSDQDRHTAKQIVHIDEKKLKTIPLGIPDISFLSKEKARAYITQKAKINTDGLIIGTIANLYKTKGLDVLIKAIVQKKETLGDSAFVIIGEGPQRSQLESLIAKHHLSNTHLIGTIEDAARFLPAFDLFILPSRKEGFPYTLLEAVQANIPWIATRVGGNEEIASHDHTGIIIPPEDSLQLAEVIQKALHKKQIPAPPSQKKFPYKLKGMISATKTIYTQMLKP